jgi:membrane protease YdiL (CAAX protease family)
MEQAYRSHPLVTFFVLAFAITWVVWIPRASGVPLGVLGQVWTWIPAIAALLAVVIVGPAIFSLVVAGVYVLLGGSWAAALPPVLLGEAALVMLPVFLMILTITDGLGEELAWRGFALPRLLLQHNALVASLILGVLWTLWHLPLIWTQGASMYQQPIWLMLVDIPANSVVFTWVFLHTRGSVLLAMLLHGAANLFNVSPNVISAGDLTLPLLAVAAKGFLIGVLILVVGPNLARGPRPEALP